MRGTKKAPRPVGGVPWGCLDSLILAAFYHTTGRPFAIICPLQQSERTDLFTRLSIPPVYLALALGVVSVSFAAIFIRLADAPPLIIASASALG